MTPQDRFEKMAMEIATHVYNIPLAEVCNVTKWQDWVHNITEALRTQASQYEGRIKELEAEILRLSRIADGWALKCDDFRWKVSSLEALLEEAKEALEKAQPYVQKVWDETKGTEREGTAMGAADTKTLIRELLQKLTERGKGKE